MHTGFCGHLHQLKTTQVGVRAHRIRSAESDLRCGRGGSTTTVCSAYTESADVFQKASGTRAVLSCFTSMLVTIPTRILAAVFQPGADWTRSSLAVSQYPILAQIPGRTLSAAIAHRLNTAVSFKRHSVPVRRAQTLIRKIDVRRGLGGQRFEQALSVGKLLANT